MHSRLTLHAARILLLLFLSLSAAAQPSVKLRPRDYRRDVELVTTEGTIRLRLSDSTPLHRDNFLRLVKSGYFDSVLFHRVIRGFMIQGGDPDSRRAAAGQKLGEGGPAYGIPAELRATLFHRKGALAAAREGDAINPLRYSSASQFYIVQGRTFTDPQMDSIERTRLQDRKISPERRAVYRATGGTPQLDGNYTVFGEVVKGLDVVDRIAAADVSSDPPNRPVQDVRIITARLVRRR
ncbi:peptidylprolyl isomerase [Flaviaesturariibacter aridisoli]|uniref:Peptidyl-prolyl cis-trans isomerase n=1 Tax=Flaviaesturariibacter aridisoli TaxID=2545761 RepID=A0A4R4DYS1_9BACT|nr:peptidylprolyl isomerase [Flaviaesturariibacter aridisoli]TCZ70992.1 peptidylprolyl isomerase [Flaviaesturariibacter aridisoli]